MQKSNVNACPHRGNHSQVIRTSDGRSAVLCDACANELQARLGFRSVIGLMVKSTMTSDEICRMRHERENMRLEQRLRDMAETAFAVAGYPAHMMLPAPEVAL